MGNGSIDNALARSLKLTPEQVAELRPELSLETPADSTGSGQPGALQPADVVRREMQTLARELLSSIRFYGSQSGAAPVGSVVVSGSLVALPGFLKRLGSDLGMPVSPADPFSRVELGPDFIHPEQSAGLSLPSDSGSRTEMKAVNLLPPDRPSTSTSTGLDSSRKKLLLVCAVVGVLVIAGLATMVWSSGSSLSKKRSELAAIQSQIASTSSATNAATSAAAGTRSSIVIGLVANRLSWDQFLGTLSKVMPENVWLQTLQSTVAGAAATLATNQAAAAAASAPAPTTTTGTSTTRPRLRRRPRRAPSRSPATRTRSRRSHGSAPPRPRSVAHRRQPRVQHAGDGGADTVYQFSVQASVISPEATP